MHRINVVCAEHRGRLNLTEAQLDALRALSPRLEITYVPYTDAGALRAALAEAEVLYTFQADFDPAWAPHLRWIQLYTAGFDHMLGSPVLASGVTVTTAAGIHGSVMAEFVMGMMLAIARKLPKMVRLKAERSWEGDVWLDVLGTELHDKTLGIVGYGRIGREIGRAARCFGMRVLGLKRSLAPGQEAGDGIADRLYRPDGLCRMLRECDFVVLVLPLTSDTEAMIGSAALRAMKSTAWLINVGRGAVVDEAVLVEALREGWIAGAALDAFVQEPLPPDHVLYDLPNVLITPHVAAATDQYEERALGVFRDNLRRYLAREPLRNVADIGRGY